MKMKKNNSKTHESNSYKGKKHKKFAKRTKHTKGAKHTKGTKHTKGNKHRKSTSKSTVNPKLQLDDELKNSAELSKFRDTKSISIASRLTDIKETQVGELIDMKPVHDVMLNLCIDKMTKRKYTYPDSGINKPISKNIATAVCECLFEKNKDLSVNELENRVLSHVETPGSSCIGILDTHYNKIKSKIKSKQKAKSKTKSK